MDGEQDGAQEAGQGQQGQQTNDAQQNDEQMQQATQVDDAARGGVGEAGDEGSDSSEQADDYKAILAERDKKIADLEGQIAEAAKSVEAANKLAEQIESLRKTNEAERVEFELKLAGCRSVRAARALLEEHDGDVSKLKAAEPWLFIDAAPESGTTGLEPAGAAVANDAEMKRWREIAGLDDEE
mgnify:CR=1 FL=1